VTCHRVLELGNPYARLLNGTEVYDGYGAGEGPVGNVHPLLEHSEPDAYLSTTNGIEASQKEGAMDQSNGNLDKFPDSWVDPLQLYGAHLNDLKLFGCSLDAERDTLKELIEKNGARWVWDNRHRLFSVAKALKDYPRK
jgi:hypothetical protein